MLFRSSCLSLTLWFIMVYLTYRHIAWNEQIDFGRFTWTGNGGGRDKWGKRVQVVVTGPGTVLVHGGQTLPSDWNSPKVCNFLSDYCSTTRHAQLVLITSHSMTFCVLKVHFSLKLSISTEQVPNSTNECLVQSKMWRYKAGKYVNTCIYDEGKSSLGHSLNIIHSSL